MTNQNTTEASSQAEEGRALSEFESTFGKDRLVRSKRNTRFITIAVLGAFLAASLIKVDVYSLAIGSLSPDSYLKSIDAPRTGAIEQVLAKNGQSVTAGQPILVYDCSPQKNQSEAASLQLKDIERELVTQSALVSNIAPGLGDANNALPSSREVALRASLHQASVKSAMDGAKRAETRIGSAQARLAASNSRKVLAQQRFDRVKQLNDRGFATRAAMDQAASERQEAQSNMELAQSDLSEARQAAAQARTEAASAALEGQNLAVTRLSSMRAEALNLRTELAKLEAGMTNCDVSAPATGQLFWLDSIAPGAWLRSATPLAKVVPKSQTMVIEAKLRNQDIPFVKVGQRAIVKLDSLPFQRYGSLDGKVRFVAPDAVVDDLGESFYRVDIEIVSIPPEARRELPELISGMDAQVNVITDERRLISYFFDPIILAFRESFHER